MSGGPRAGRREERREWITPFGDEIGNASAVGWQAAAACGCSGKPWQKLPSSFAPGGDQPQPAF
jgi:hypothetical protein